MLSRFEQQMAVNDLCKREDKILLAVSGGVDSMTMLDIFHLLEYTVGVAHCNFQLRGAQSDNDESLIRTICNQKEIPFYVTHLDTKSYAKKNKLSLQVAARKLRYAWLADVLDKQNYQYIATAHHANDNIETIILNFVRGSGLEGLKGIPVKTGKIIRPLLHFTRDEIEKYAQKNKILWREDATNQTERYSRNKIRLQLIPMLKKLNPSLETTFLRTQQRLVAAGELFDLGKHYLKESFVTSEADDIKIHKSITSTVQNPVPVVWEMIKKYGFNYSQCQDIVDRLDRGTGKKFLSPTHQLTIDREFMLISATQYSWETVPLSQQHTQATLGPWTLTVIFSTVTTPNTDQCHATLDADTIAFPLQWRKWQNGDYFYPLGMNRRKKLSNFFIDEKLSLADKGRATVVESNGDIVWVAGYRIDHRFRVTKKTVHVIRLSLKSCFSM